VAIAWSLLCELVSDHTVFEASCLLTAEVNCVIGFMFTLVMSMHTHLQSASRILYA